MKSLRARLLIAVGGATLLVWAVTAALAYLSARHEAAELLDAQLAQSTRLLLQRVAFEDQRQRSDEGEGEDDEEVTDKFEHDRLNPYVQDQTFTVWRLPGHVLLRTDNAPAMGLLARTGYSDLIEAGRTWRVLSRRDATGRYQVQIAQPTQGRDRAALEVAMRIAGPMAIALPLLIGFIYLAVRRGLAPLNALAGEVARRKPDELAPLDADDTPPEASPLVAALNDLLARIAGTLDNERRFTADAAHELRTPLAALKVQAQVAGMANDEATRMHAIGQVLAGADRAAHLVEQLLRLARLDPLRGPVQMHPCGIEDLLLEAVAALAHLAHEKGVTLSIEAPQPPVMVAGDPEMIAVALRNLVENAVRYTPAGGRVQVGADCAQGVRLWVRDDGPGVAANELDRLTERFYRGREVTSEGSGLGLAIVRRIAELHGAGLALANRSTGGFEAALVFPSEISRNP